VSRPLAVAVTGRGLVDPQSPVLAADDEGFTRGRAAFETMRVYGGRPYRYDEHVTRLERSATRIGLPVPSRDGIDEITRLALAAAGLADAALRLYWTPGPPGGPAEGIALVSAVPAWIDEARTRGQRLVSLLTPRRDVAWLLPGTKSTSYAVNMAAEAEAKRRGADDAVFVDVDGVLLEGPVTNIWWREGHVLHTPALDLGILAGETRAAILELAAAEGFVVEEGVYPIDRLAVADEVFTSSSVREVMPVIAVDELTFPRGEAAETLQAALRRAAHG
jgi:branched-subunit amino acid aminotransferase/4-amino-4-deoxychorismate lyase